MKQGPASVTIATAGWAIPRETASAFPPEGSGLERYADRLDGVEINSTFYRSHRQSTFARWAEATPPGFRFAVKLPRTITHENRLLGVEPLIAEFCQETASLGDKLGPLLVQLPPSLVYEAVVHDRFFKVLRAHWSGPVVCEPRHVGWFADEADAMLRHWRVSRVAADPARHPMGGMPGGWRGLAYWRLHGAPRIYSSPYSDAVLADLARRLAADPADASWCVFDNTASGAAAANALTLQGLLKHQAD